MKNKYSGSAWLMAMLMIAGTVLLAPRYDRTHTEATLTWDVSGYYLYLPAIFIYQDLEHLSFLPDILARYQPSYAADQAFDHPGGGRILKYPAGMALLYLPAFGVGHLLARVGGYAADGFSYPYQLAVHWGSVWVALMGLWVLRRVLLRYMDDRTTAGTLVLVALGTNFFNYATFDAAMPHAYGFLLTALVVDGTIRWQDRPDGWAAARLGGLIGLAALVRPTEVLTCLIPLCWGVTGWRSGLQRVQWLWRHRFRWWPAVVAAAAVGSLQLVYWKYAGGEWLVYSYQQQGFHFLHPHWEEVLFSYRKGWLVYTPLVLFMLAGGWPFREAGRRPASECGERRPLRELWLPCAAYVGAGFWGVSAWEIWWYGGAFGQRALIPTFVLLAFPLSALLAAASRWPSLPRRALWAALGACLLLNLFQTYQAHEGPWEADMMNKAYFWRIFGRVTDNPYDKILLDVGEGYHQERRNKRLFGRADFETGGVGEEFSAGMPPSGRRVCRVDARRKESPAMEWDRPADLAAGDGLQVRAWFHSPEVLLEPWWMPQCVVQLVGADGAVLRERLMRPGRLLNSPEWRLVWMDIRVPEKPFHKIKVFLRVPGEQGSLVMDDLEVVRYDR